MPLLVKRSCVVCYKFLDNFVKLTIRYFRGLQRASVVVGYYFMGGDLAFRGLQMLSELAETPF